MKNYIGSQQHFEDCVNAHYDKKEQIEKEMREQIEKEQIDDRIQCPATMGTCERGCIGGIVNCYQLADTFTTTPPPSVNGEEKE